MIVSRAYLEDLVSKEVVTTEEWLQLQTLMWRCSHGTHIEWTQELEALVPYTGLSMERLRELGIAPELAEDEWWFA